MRRKARDILRDQQGLAMILVLCLGALFVALSAALVYAASVLTANANRQLLEQEAAQQRPADHAADLRRRQGAQRPAAALARHLGGHQRHGVRDITGG